MSDSPVFYTGSPNELVFFLYDEHFFQFTLILEHGLFCRDEQEVLDKIKAGYVYAEPDRAEQQTSNTSPAAGRSSRKTQTDRQSDRQTDRVKLIRDAETRLDELLLEKRQVISH